MRLLLSIILIVSLLTQSLIATRAMACATVCETNAAACCCCGPGEASCACDEGEGTQPAQPAQDAKDTRIDRVATDLLTFTPMVAPVERAIVRADAASCPLGVDAAPRLERQCVWRI